MDNYGFVVLDGKRYKIIRENYLISDDENDIIFDGYRYHWWGDYYRRSSSPRNPHTQLHRAIYEFHNGKIKDWHHIHHINGNTKDNDISNLQEISISDHMMLHQTDERKEQSRKSIMHAMEYAKEWHNSEEGRAWHKQHFNNSLVKVFDRKIVKSCVVCDKKFTTCFEHAKYCSNKCKTKARYLSGVDNETRSCSICNNEFVCNKYSAKKTCSKNCAVKLSSIKRKMRREQRA